MKKTRLICALALLAATNIFATQNTRVYNHLDKPIYYMGETILPHQTDYTQHHEWNGSSEIYIGNNQKQKIVLSEHGQVCHFSPWGPFNYPDGWIYHVNATDASDHSKPITRAMSFCGRMPSLNSDVMTYVSISPNADHPEKIDIQVDNKLKAKHYYLLNDV
jgi:hypothetical protein